MAPGKVEGPNTTLVFLGIELETVGLQLRVPSEKLVCLKALIQSWSRKKVASKRELQLLIGHLSYAATVVKSGRTFMRHLIEASKVPKQASLWVHLNINCRADLVWWELFIEQWNGHTIMPSTHHSFSSCSDASGGCGAVSSTHEWFQLQ